mgnify:CR=1 FL=1
MSQYKDLLFEVRDGVARITINRPEKYNAFTAETCEELIDALKRAGWDKSVAVIVLTAVLAPLIANDRPIVMSYKGEWLVPVLVDYPEEKFGGFLAQTQYRDPEIQKEIRLALQAVGRNLGLFLRRRLRVQQEGQRRTIFLRYLGEVARGVAGDLERAVEAAGGRVEIGELSIVESVSVMLPEFAPDDRMTWLPNVVSCVLISPTIEPLPSAPAAGPDAGRAPPPGSRTGPRCRPAQSPAPAPCGARRSPPRRRGARPRRRGTRRPGTGAAPPSPATDRPPAPPRGCRGGGAW